MPISEAEAVAAAREFADRKTRPVWREGSVRVDRVVVGGHECWRVRADDVPPPGEPDWFFEYDGGQSYLVDVDSGDCIGVGLINGHTLFVPDKA